MSQTSLPNVTVSTGDTRKQNWHLYIIRQSSTHNADQLPALPCACAVEELEEDSSSSDHQDLRATTDYGLNISICHSAATRRPQQIIGRPSPCFTPAPSPSLPPCSLRRPPPVVWKNMFVFGEKSKGAAAADITRPRGGQAGGGGRAGGQAVTPLSLVAGWLAHR